VSVGDPTRGIDLMVTEGVLVTGVYGTGKTSVCEELAELLESAGVAYGAIDLDWLTWFGIAGLDSAAVRRVELANIATVVNNYVEAGVKRFVLAGAVRSNVELAAMRAVVPFPLKAVRLTLSIEDIERRLAVAVTVGRERDARNAARWLAEGIGADVGDLVIANDRPIGQVAEEILDWLRWA
jgi:hypothetical protein